MSKGGFIALGGENLIDHVTTEGDVVAHPGGSPYNVAMALGRQEVPVRYVSPISNDTWGDLLADTLTASGVTLSGARVKEPTTLARVTVSNGIPSYGFERDGTAERMVRVEDLTAHLAGAVALHTGSLALTDGPDADVWEAVCKAAYAAGCVVSIDPNVRLSVISEPESYRARLFRMMGKTHIVKLSDEDLDGLFPGMGQAAALSELRAITSATLLVLTQGSGGCSAWLRDLKIDIPAAPVPNLVDTVGAGDTFTATLLAGLYETQALSPDGLSNLTPAELTTRLERASQAAAINCSRAGCNPPTRADLNAALSTQA